MTDPTPRTIPTIPDSIPQDAGGNHGDQSSNDRSLSGSEDGLTLQSLHDLCLSLCKQVTGQAIEIKALKAQVKKLKRRARPVINHHKAWLRATSLKKKRGVFKQGRKVVKSSKGAPSIPINDEWDDLDMDIDDTMQYTIAEDMEKGRSSEGIDKENQGTDSTKVSTDKVEQGTDKVEEAVSREKEKGVELKDVENIERPRPTSTVYVLTLKPLLKIDPKDKGKKRIEEEESKTESEGINESKKKFMMLAHDEEIARKIQEEWEVEEEKNRLATEEAINVALIQELDDVKLRKGGKKHADLKNRNFDDIQALYERIKRYNDKFLAVGSTEDERKIKEMNDKAKDHELKRVKKKVVQETLKDEVTAKSQPNDDSDIDKDDAELRLSLIIVLDEDKEVDYEILDRKYPIIEWKSEYLTTKPQLDESKGLEEVNLNMVVRSNGQRRHFNTLMRDWKIVCWKLHSSSRLKLESEEDSTMALELIRFVKKKIVELELNNSDGDEK
ncbi:hypothetical protein Tco_1541283 [Tanacetum coccineum]